MSAHTPGPWNIGDWGHIVSAYGRICTVAPKEGAANVANARLIAAAPKALLLARYAVDNPDFDSAVFDHMAREFIAEATGEQP